MVVITLSIQGVQFGLGRTLGVETVITSRWLRRGPASFQLGYPAI